MNAITIQEILTYGGGILLALSALVEVSPIKVNPWSAIASAIGRVINKEVMAKLDQVEAAQKQTQKQLEQMETAQKQIKEHLEESDRVNDDRNADIHRRQILRFNVELMRNERHTREDFIEVLAEIDAYERYCKAHPDYPNNRATHAIANIERVYDELQKTGDFFMAGGET